MLIFNWLSSGYNRKGQDISPALSCSFWIWLDKSVFLRNSVVVNDFVHLFAYAAVYKFGIMGCHACVRMSHHFAHDFQRNIVG